MKNIYNLLIMLLLFVVFVPSVQSNVFEDIQNIDSGIDAINDKLELIGSDIGDLVISMDEMNNTLDITNKEIEDLNNKFDELSNTSYDAIVLAEKVNVVMEDIKIILLVGVICIVVSILIAASMFYRNNKRKN